MQRTSILTIALLATLAMTACGDADETPEPEAGMQDMMPDEDPDGPQEDMQPEDLMEDAFVPDESLPVCDGVGHALVADIDNTLTANNDEILRQLSDGNYDPEVREGAADMLQEYARRGYWIIYVTARPENIELGVTGEPMRDATARWLEEKGFPTDEARTALFLMPSFSPDDEERRIYKASTLLDLIDAGHTFDFAYGDAHSDALAYEDAGIPKNNTFMIGEEAGIEGTVAIDAEGWTEHSLDHMASVEAHCRPQ